MQKSHIEFIDIGNTVLCDFCNGDYTESEEKGGMVFCSDAVCPKCQPEFEESIEKHKEEDLIDATCPPGVTFREFILKYRNGADFIAIETWEN